MERDRQQSVDKEEVGEEVDCGILVVAPFGVVSVIVVEDRAFQESSTSNSHKCTNNGLKYANDRYKNVQHVLEVAHLDAAGL